MKIKIALLFLLLLFTCVGLVFYFLFIKLYRKELSLRLSPITENELLTAKTVKFWFLGDSRIYQWNIPESVIPKNDYCNLGINAQTSGQVLYRLGLHLQQGLPEYVFLQVGINDIKAIGIFPEKQEAILNKCVKNIELLLKTCISFKVIPIFCTIIPPGAIKLIRRPLWNYKINSAVAEVNDTISKFCKMNGIAVFDIYSFLSDGKGVLIKNYQQDDLHLNQEGYNKLNSELATFMMKEKIVK